MSRTPLKSEIETLAYERDAYHVATGGNLYLINFDVDSFELKPQHKAAIERLVVPFIENSIRRFGPGEYQLHVVGSASATGSRQHDKDLADARASEAGNYAIKLFRQKQMSDSSLKADLYLDTQSIGKELAEIDPLIRNARTSKEVERRQPAYRSVLFIFKAGFKHPAGASTFLIREHFFFSFKKIEEPLPVFLRRIDDFITKHPVIKQLFPKLVDKVIKPLKDLAIYNPASLIAKHIVGMMIPENADYAYEAKDYRSTHALYRYNTSNQHSDMTSFAELLGLLGSLSSAIKAISNALSLEGNVEKWMSTILTEFDAQVKGWLQRLEPVLGAETTAAIRAFLELAKQGKLQQSLFAPTSGWSPFQFYDHSPDHNVSMLAGEAKRTSAEALFRSIVELNFGGAVPNNWVDYNATAFLDTVSGRNSLLGGMANSSGQLIFVRGAYFSDLLSGPFNPVSDGSTIGL